jgi:hypothetical protein
MSNTHGNMHDDETTANPTDEAHQRQVAKTMDTLAEGPEGLYERPPDISRRQDRSAIAVTKTL